LVEYQKAEDEFTKRKINLSKLLKDLYNEKYITILSDNIKKYYEKFDVKSFKLSVFDDKWKEKKLKERMRHISNSLYHFLPKSYKESIFILKKVFFQMNSQFYLENMIFQDFVEVYGVEDFETSIDALESFTINSSSEFAIRQFIIKYPKKTMSQMRLWANSENEHLRRLASEGCRPRLPWGISLSIYKKNPEDILSILEILKDDESPYVRKSVANNLNDISKDNPQVVKNITKKWIGIDKKRDSLLKHGCRTLLKNCDREILDIFGFKERKNLFLDNYILDSRVKFGDILSFSFSLNSKEFLGKLRVEYSIEFLRQNDKYSKKVFKIAEGEYKQKSKTFSKYYSFKPISTRKYYKGKHRLNIVVNGVVLQSGEFNLI
jgi:3-methyladenine DNA glycosylase AlkC